jgi:hypothetical protein
LDDAISPSEQSSVVAAEQSPDPLEWAASRQGPPLVRHRAKKPIVVRTRKGEGSPA